MAKQIAPKSIKVEAGIVIVEMGRSLKAYGLKYGQQVMIKNDEHELAIPGKVRQVVYTYSNIDTPDYMGRGLWKGAKRHMIEVATEHGLIRVPYREITNSTDIADSVILDEGEAMAFYNACLKHSHYLKGWDANTIMENPDGIYQMNIAKFGKFFS